MNIEIQIQNRSGNTNKIKLNENITVEEAKKINGESKNVVWKFDGQVMNNSKTLSYYGIEDGDIIISVYNIVGGGGCFGLNTIDITKNQTRIVEFDPNAPYYRYVLYGLNIQAICGNDCIAKDKIVYCKIGFVRDYNLLNHLGDIKCPACHNEVYPKNFGFLRCNYKIDYEKWDNYKKKSGTVNGKVGDEFTLFAEYSGNANFTKLIFNIY